MSLPTRRHFRLLYQPRVKFRERKVAGAEALLRICSGTRMESPERYLALAERTGSILDIGKWVLNRACAEARKLGLSGHELPMLSINVSAVQVHQRSFVASVLESVKNS